MLYIRCEVKIIQIFQPLLEENSIMILITAYDEKHIVDGMMDGLEVPVV